MKKKKLRSTVSLNPQPDRRRQRNGRNTNRILMLLWPEHWIVLELEYFLICMHHNNLTITFRFSLKSNIVNPTLDQAPKTQYVFLNRTSNLWCPVKGAPAPYIVWRKDGVAVQNSTSITFQLKVTSENNVNYSCEVRRDGEVLRRDISLRIEGEVLLFCWSISVLCIIGLSKPVLFHLLKILTTRKKVQTTLVVGSYLTFQN